MVCNWQGLCGTFPRQNSFRFLIWEPQGFVCFLNKFLAATIQKWSQRKCLFIWRQSDSHCCLWRRRFLKFSRCFLGVFLVFRCNFLFRIDWPFQNFKGRPSRVKLSVIKLSIKTIRQKIDRAFGEQQLLSWRSNWDYEMTNRFQI